MHLRSLPLLVALFGASALHAQQQRYEVVRPNDNRARAGISSGNIVAVRIEARIAIWHPNGEDQPGAAIPVFAEIGRPAQVPGPMIRVPGGTDVIATVRNAIPGQTLTIHGLHSRPVVGAAFNDSITLVPGQVSTLRFRLDRPGTYYYWGTTSGAAFGDRRGADAQLTGAIVVDEPGQRTPRDRVFIIGMWGGGIDTSTAGVGEPRQRELVVMNGRAWPHTDRVQYEQGDSIRWRVINASADAHPMHLHGYHFRVNRRGDARADTLLSNRDLAHTEYMPAGGTTTISWLADRQGNWLFHCAERAHSEPRGALGFQRPSRGLLEQTGGVATSAYYMNAMGGLIAGIEVLRQEGDTTPLPPLPEPVRRIRMVVRPNPGSTPSRPYYGVTFSESDIDPEVPIGQSVGPTLLLNRGEPVSIMVHNRTPEPTTIHWHGLEPPNYYDGVPGFSGIRPEVAPAIAPGDSFEVRLAPPRAGTYLYLAHTDEARQQRAGLLGAVIVSEPGRHDPQRELTVLVSSPSDSAEHATSVLVNGALLPPPAELRPGASYRLRLANATVSRRDLTIDLLQDSTLVTWRPVAKDGVELPAARRALRPATQRITIGETMDVEFFPTRPGDYRIELRDRGGLVGTLPIVVR